MFQPDAGREFVTDAVLDYSDVIADLPEDYFERCKLLPVEDPGFFDQMVEELAQIDDEMIEGSHYAWVKPPRFVHQRRATYKETEGPFRLLDIGSSVPFYPELISSLHFNHCAHKSDGLVKTYMDSTILDLAAVEPAVFEPWLVNSVQERISNKNYLIRSMVASHLRKVLYMVKESDIGKTDEQTALNLCRMLQYEMLCSREMYVTAQDRRYYDGRYNLDTTRIATDQTVVELLAATAVPTAAAHALGQVLKQRDAAASSAEAEVVRQREPLGTHRATIAVQHMALRLSQAAVAAGVVRPFSVYSADLAPPAELLAAASGSFDRATRLTGVYKRALERLSAGRNHLTIDAFSADLDVVADGSVSLITMFDFFPIGFKIPEDATPEDLELYRTIVMTAGERWYRKLQKHGRMVIFTWDVANKGPQDQQLLDDMLRMWDRLGADVSIKIISKERLYMWMEPGERKYLASRSPLFQTDFDLFRVLIVEKMPDKGLLRPIDSDEY